MKCTYSDSMLKLKRKTPVMDDGLLNTVYGLHCPLCGRQFQMLAVDLSRTQAYLPPHQSALVAAK